MSTNLLILGSGPGYEHAVQIANMLADFQVQAVEIVAADRFNFELPDLAAYPPTDWSLFVGLDERALNISRHQLIAKVKAAGYRLSRLVSPDALISDTATMGENTLVQKGAIIGARTKLGLNVMVGPGATIGHDCRIGSGVFIEAGCVVGHGVELGDYVTLGLGAVVQEGAKIGRYSELRHPKTYRGAIPERTFYLDIFPNPVSIISPL